MSKSKVVLITGSSSGFGKHTALFFAKKGWQVVASMRNPEKSCKELSELDKPVLDVTDRDSIHKCVRYVIEKYGSIDVLVNNAGAALAGPLEGVSDHSISQLFNTNILGLINVTREVIPYMRQSNYGTIVNISSVVGRIGAPFLSIYVATKFAVTGFTESMRYELYKKNIKLKLVEPGTFRTNLLNSMEWAHQPAYSEFESYKEALIHGFKKGAPPLKVAKVIYRAATDGSNKLRYPVNASTLMLLHSILPDAIWRRAMKILIKNMDKQF